MFKKIKEFLKYMFMSNEKYAELVVKNMMKEIKEESAKQKQKILVQRFKELDKKNKSLK